MWHWSNVMNLQGQVTIGRSYFAQSSLGSANYERNVTCSKAYNLTTSPSYDSSNAPTIGDRALRARSSQQRVLRSHAVSAPGQHTTQFIQTVVAQPVGEGDTTSTLSTSTTRSTETLSHSVITNDNDDSELEKRKNCCAVFREEEDCSYCCDENCCESCPSCWPAQASSCLWLRCSCLRSPSSFASCSRSLCCAKPSDVQDPLPAVLTGKQQTAAVATASLDSDNRNPILKLANRIRKLQELRLR